MEVHIRACAERGTSPHAILPGYLQEAKGGEEIRGRPEVV